MVINVGGGMVINTGGDMVFSYGEEELLRYSFEEQDKDSVRETLVAGYDEFCRLHPSVSFLNVTVTFEMVY